MGAKLDHKKELRELFHGAEFMACSHNALNNDLPHPSLREWLFQEYCRKIPTARVLSFLRERGLSIEELKDAENTILSYLMSQKEKGPLNSPPDFLFTSDVWPRSIDPDIKPSCFLYNSKLTVKEVSPGIRIFDDFLSEEGFNTLSKLVDSAGFHHGKVSNTRHANKEVGLWFRSFFAQAEDNRRFDVARSQHMLKSPFLSDLWSHATHITGAKNLVRAYANGYTYGTDATAHRDDSIIYRTEAHPRDRPATILFYLNDEWNKDWAGETVFFDDDGEILASVLPKRNRVCVFDGTIQHAARPVSRYCVTLRKIFVFKTAPFTVHGEDDAISVILSATNGIQHSGGLFSDHLIATSAILAKLGAPKYLCDAALYHSAYGTSYFQVDTSFNKDGLVQLIGERAEKLVDIFCKTENRIPSIIENRGGWGTETYRDLLLLEYANLLEQEPRLPSITEKGYLPKIISIFKEKYGVDLPPRIDPWKKDR